MYYHLFCHIVVYYHHPSPPSSPFFPRLDMIPMDSATGVLVTALAAVGMVISVGFVIFLQVYRKRAVIKVSQPLFCKMFCLGSASCCGR